MLSWSPVSFEERPFLDCGVLWAHPKLWTHCTCGRLVLRGIGGRRVVLDIYPY
jgi:hypothetical protein